MTEDTIVLTPDAFETLTDPDSGEKSISITTPNRDRLMTSIIQDKEIIALTMNPNHNLINMRFQVSADLYIYFNVTEAGKDEIIEFLFGITEHFYTGIRIIPAPGIEQHYAFISTNRNTRVIAKSDIAGWEFKNTSEDGIHNLCINLKSGHTVLVVVPVLVYKGWEEAHLGRYNYLYVNYDGTRTEDPVYPPEPQPES